MEPVVLFIGIISLILLLVISTIGSYEKGLNDGIRLTKSMYQYEKDHPNEPDVIEQQQGCPAKEDI